MKKVILVLASALVLGGCSFEDLFSLMATSDAERAQSEALARNEIVAKKLANVTAKKQSYPESTDLLKVNEGDDIAASAFRDGTKTDKVTVEIEALLPNPNNLFYEAWLKSSSGKLKNLGALEYRQLDDYGLKVEIDQEFKTYPTVLITRESVPDATPETVIMTGAFKEADVVASPSPQSP